MIRAKYSSKASTMFLGATKMMTEHHAGMSKGEPKCYNTPPPPSHNDSENDQLVGFCNLKDENLWDVSTATR